MLNWYDNNDIPDGVFHVKITSIEETTSKSSGNPMWRIKLAFKDAPVTRTIYQVIDGKFTKPGAMAFIRRKLHDMAVCFSVTPPGNSPNDWIGHTGIIQGGDTVSESGAVFFTIKKFFDPKTGKNQLFSYKQQLEAEKFFTQADNEFSDEIKNDTDPAPKPNAQSVNKNWLTETIEDDSGIIF